MISPAINRKISALAIALGSATLATAAFTPSADAFTLTYDSYFGTTNTPGTGVSAQAEFEFIDQGAGNVLLELTITNTTNNSGESLFNIENSLSDGDADYVNTSGATDGSLLGLGFDLGDAIDDVTSISYLSGSDDTFDNFFDGTAYLTGNLKDTDGNIVFGGSGDTFDIGIGARSSTSDIGGNGGSPNVGLFAGDSTTVQFSLSGNGISAASLLQSLEDGYEDGTSIAGARFRAVNAGAGSDKLAGGVLEAAPIPETPNPPKSVPEPSLMLGVGLVGAALLKHKRNQGGAKVAGASH